MSTTDSVLVLAEVGGKSRGVPLLYQGHALSVQPLDVLTDGLPIGGIVGLVGEAAAPVAEVGADDEEVGRV